MLPSGDNLLPVIPCFLIVQASTLSPVLLGYFPFFLLPDSCCLLALKGLAKVVRLTVTSVSKLRDRLEAHFFYYPQQTLLPYLADSSSADKDLAALINSSIVDKEPPWTRTKIKYFLFLFLLGIPETLVCSWTDFANFENTQLIHIQVLHTQVSLEPPSPQIYGYHQPPPSWPYSPCSHILFGVEQTTPIYGWQTPPLCLP